MSCQRAPARNTKTYTYTNTKYKIHNTKHKILVQIQNTSTNTKYTKSKISVVSKRTHPKQTFLSWGIYERAENWS